MLDASAHPNLSLALDLADKGIKLAAVLIGALWTWWNYKKSRTYAQKLELLLTSGVFVREDLYVEVKAIVKNVGAAQHRVQASGTKCEISVVRDDLSSEIIRLFPVFRNEDYVEPGESNNDTLCWKILRPIDHIVWIKVHLRVISGEVEWFASNLVRVEGSARVQTLREVV